MSFFFSADTLTDFARLSRPFSRPSRRKFQCVKRMSRQAAHTPAVWATQALDRFVRDGVANRSETSDAARGRSAQCVKLNKGPHPAEGVGFLRDALGSHRAKRYSRLRT